MRSAALRPSAIVRPAVSRWRTAASPRPAASAASERAGAPLGHLGQVLRPADEAQAAVAELQKVAGRHAASRDIVDADRAPLGVLARDPVDQDHRDAELAQLDQPWVAVVDGGDEHAADPELGQPVEEAVLSPGVVVRVAQEERQTRALGDLVDTPGDVGEEGVGRVEDDVGDGAALAGHQLAGRGVRHESELVDRRLDRARVAGRTADGRFNTFETVPTDTPACRATSLMLTGDVRRLAAVRVAHRGSYRVKGLVLGQVPADVVEAVREGAPRPRLDEHVAQGGRLHGSGHDGRPAWFAVSWQRSSIREPPPTMWMVSTGSPLRLAAVSAVAA